MQFANYICNALCVWMLSGVLMRSHGSFHSAAGSHTQTLFHLVVLRLSVCCCWDSGWGQTVADSHQRFPDQSCAIRNIGFLGCKWQKKKNMFPLLPNNPNIGALSGLSLAMKHFVPFTFGWAFHVPAASAQLLHLLRTEMLPLSLKRVRTHKKKLLLKRKDLLTSTKLIF